MILYAFIGIILIAILSITSYLYILLIKSAMSGRFYPIIIMIFLSFLSTIFNRFEIKNRLIIKGIKFFLWASTVLIAFVTLFHYIGYYSIAFAIISVIILKKRKLANLIPQKENMFGSRLFTKFGNMSFFITESNQVIIKKGLVKYKLAFLGIRSMNNLYTNLDKILKEAYSRGISFVLEISQYENTIYTYISTVTNLSENTIQEINNLKEILRKYDVSIAEINDQYNVFYAFYTPIIANFVIEKTTNFFINKAHDFYVIDGQKRITSFFDEVEDMEQINFHLFLKFRPLSKKDVFAKKKTTLQKIVKKFKEEKDFVEQISFLALIDNQTASQLMDLEEFKNELMMLKKMEEWGIWAVDWILVLDHTANNEEINYKTGKIDANILFSLVSRKFKNKSEEFKTPDSWKNIVMNILSKTVTLIAK